MFPKELWKLFLYVCVLKLICHCIFQVTSLLGSFSIKLWMKREESEQDMEARDDGNGNEWGLRQSTGVGNLTIMTFYI